MTSHASTSYRQYKKVLISSYLFYPQQFDCTAHTMEGHNTPSDDQQSFDDSNQSQPSSWIPYGAQNTSQASPNQSYPGSPYMNADPNLGSNNSFLSAENRFLHAGPALAAPSRPRARSTSHSRNNNRLHPYLDNSHQRSRSASRPPASSYNHFNQSQTPLYGGLFQEFEAASDIVSPSHHSLLPSFLLDSGKPGSQPRADSQLQNPHIWRHSLDHLRVSLLRHQVFGEMP
jgi:hypothetical protein